MPESKKLIGRIETVLKLDIDQEERDVDRVNSVVRMLALRRNECDEWSRTEHGWHVRIFVDGLMPAKDVVLLQALMGSDWKRETLNYLRASKRPKKFLKMGNVLFYKKMENGKITSQERPVSRQSLLR